MSFATPLPDEDWYTYAQEFQTLDAISYHTGIPIDLLILKHQKTMRTYA